MLDFFFFNAPVLLFFRINNFNNLPSSSVSLSSLILYFFMMFWSFPMHTQVKFEPKTRRSTWNLTDKLLQWFPLEFLLTFKLWIVITLCFFDLNDGVSFRVVDGYASATMGCVIGTLSWVKTTKEKKEGKKKKKDPDLNAHT